ncbi:MAG: hypothetical protein R3F23_05500 [Verrucomicrobiia bacterium]
MKYFTFFTILFLPFTILQAGGGKPKIALRIHLESEGALPSDKIVNVVLEKPPKTIAIVPVPELSELNLLDAQPYSDLPNSALLTFNTHGTSVLNVTTTANRGKHLVVFINGRVVYAPIIDTTLPNGKLLIPNNVTEEELIELQKWAKRNQKKKI